MNNYQLLTALLQYGVQATLSDVDEILATIDMPALIAQHRARITIDIWDGQSPINGVSAERVKQMENLPSEAKGYWIIVDNRPRYFQVTSPYSGDRVMLDPEPAAIQHATHLSEELAHEEVLQILLSRLSAAQENKRQELQDDNLLILEGITVLYEMLLKEGVV